MENAEVPWEKSMEPYCHPESTIIKKCFIIFRVTSPSASPAYSLSIKGYEKFPEKQTEYYLGIIWKGYVNSKIMLAILREAVAENQKEISDIEST